MHGKTLDAKIIPINKILEYLFSLQLGTLEEDRNIQKPNQCLPTKTSKKSYQHPLPAKIISIKNLKKQINHEEWSNKIENRRIHIYTSDLSALEKTGLKFGISMPVTYIWSVKTCPISPSRDILCRDMIKFYQALIDWLYMGEDARLMDTAAIPDILVIPQYLCQCARLTNGISIEFENRPKFVVFWFKIYSTDHNEIVHTSRQCNSRDVCKISLWSIKYISN